jgi:hypothetical protein
METSNWIALGALTVALIAMVISYRTREANLIAEMKAELASAAINCNKFIIPGTLGHTNINQELSEIFTCIIDSRDELGRFFKKHKVLALTSDPEDLIRYFYKKLHTSNRELIKNRLWISNYDPATSPRVEGQHLECRDFFQPILD